MTNKQLEQLSSAQGAVQINNTLIEGVSYLVIRIDNKLTLQREGLRSATETPLSPSEELIVDLCRYIIMEKQKT